MTPDEEHALEHEQQWELTDAIMDALAKATGKHGSINVLVVQAALGYAVTVSFEAVPIDKRPKLLDNFIAILRDTVLTGETLQ